MFLFIFFYIPAKFILVYICPYQKSLWCKILWSITYLPYTKTCPGRNNQVCLCNHHICYTVAINTNKSKFFLILYQVSSIHCSQHWNSGFIHKFMEQSSCPSRPYTITCNQYWLSGRQMENQ